VDAASIEGFFKSLFHRLNRYPAFIVDGKKYVGDDFSRVDALISEGLAAEQVVTPRGISESPGGR